MEYQKLIEFERIILSTMLDNYEECQPTLVEYNIQADYFTPLHRTIFDEIVKHKGTLNLELLMLNLVPQQIVTPEDAEIQQVILALAKTAPQSKSLFDDYCERLISAKKILLENEAKDGISRELLVGGDIEKVRHILEEVEKRKSEIDIQDTWDNHEVIKRRYEERLQERKTTSKDNIIGMSYGFKEIDEKTLGLQKGQLIIIGAGTSVGKTAFALSLVTHFARQCKNGLFVSTEMDAVSLTDRLIAHHSEIPVSKLMIGNLDEHEEKLRDDFFNRVLKHIYIQDKGIKLSSLERLVIKAKNAGIDYIVVDYLQMINADTAKKNANRAEEVSLITKKLKRLALDYDIPIIALSQLNRQGNSRENRRPQLSDLRESGAIEQDADCVLLLYRPTRDKINELKWKIERAESGEYNPKGSLGELQEKLKELSASKKAEDCEVIIAKNRQGACGSAKILYNSPLTYFYERKATEAVTTYQPTAQPKKEPPKQQPMPKSLIPNSEIVEIIQLD